MNPSCSTATYSGCVNPGANNAVMAFIGAYFIFVLILLVFYFFCGWKIYAKAGKPGWAAIIPFYNFWVMLEIVGRPSWWFVFIFAPIIPVIGSLALLVVEVILAIDMAKSFGKDTSWGIIWLVLLGFIGIPMLAFGDAKYVGPAATPPAA